MGGTIPLFLVGMPRDDPKNEILVSKFEAALEKALPVFSSVLEAKIYVKSQNREGSRTHYEVTVTVVTSKDRFVYTESDWDVLKVCDILCKKIEAEISKHNKKRQRDSIRKKEAE